MSCTPVARSIGRRGSELALLDARALQRSLRARAGGRPLHDLFHCSLLALASALPPALAESADRVRACSARDYARQELALRRVHARPPRARKAPAGRASVRDADEMPRPRTPFPMCRRGNLTRDRRHLIGVGPALLLDPICVRSANTLVVTWIAPRRRRGRFEVGDPITSPRTADHLLNCGSREVAPSDSFAYTGAGARRDGLERSRISSSPRVATNPPGPLTDGTVLAPRCSPRALSGVELEQPRSRRRPRRSHAVSGRLARASTHEARVAEHVSPRSPLRPPRAADSPPSPGEPAARSLNARRAGSACHMLVIRSAPSWCRSPRLRPLPTQNALRPRPHALYAFVQRPASASSSDDVTQLELVLCPAARSREHHACQQRRAADPF